jgi:adenylate kinase
VKIILFGPPAAGKGTQANLIKDTLNVPHLSTGDMLRAAVAEGSEVGKKAESIMKEGGLVSDDIIVGVIKDRLSKDDCVKGCILDGFPRTVAQAEALDAMLNESSMKIDLVIDFQVTDDELKSRVSNRRKQAEERGEEVRSDDSLEVFEKRLETYRAQTFPVLAYYKENAPEGVLKTVDGMQSIDKVSEDIKNLIN